LDDHCSVIKNAVLNTIQQHKLRTADIGGTTSTTDFVQCVLNEIIKMTPQLGFNYQMQEPTQIFRFRNID
jgi:hypothetical protein